jgi:acetyl esterase/lipase
MATALLVCGILAAVTVLNARAPRRGRLWLLPSFFTSWLTIELAPWALFWQIVTTVGLVAAGALDGGSEGWVGLGLMVGSWAGLVEVIASARRTTVTMNEAQAELELDPDDTAPPFPRSHVVFPFLMGHRSGVERRRNIVFAEPEGKPLRLDVHRPAGAGPDGGKRPGILQIHGGGWVIGDKREQGIPLLNHLAANGWVGINANYRLSPRHAFPAHLIDLKHAIAWYRDHAEEHGADPDFLCVTGGSAGGHLAALVGLTANEAEYQPGFEEVDTSVRAAVPVYGVYDFTNRFGTWHKPTVNRFFGPWIIKRSFAEAPEAFRKASPIDLVRPDAPPFLVVHGDLDVLAPVVDAREFVARLRDVSGSLVLYAEMKGSQHAFDVFPSYRTARVIEGIERFLTAVHRAYLEGRPLGPRPDQLEDDLTDDELVHSPAD